MKRNLTTVGLTVLALLAGAFAIYSFLPENEVQAATVEPVAIPDAYVLTLDSETGLPVGSVTFDFNGMACIALPNGALTCACPCDTGTCDASEVAPVSSVPSFVPDASPDREPDDTPATPGTPAETPNDGSDNSGTPDNDGDGDTEDGDAGDGDGEDGDAGEGDTGEGDTGDGDGGEDGDGDNGKNRCNQGRGNGAEGCDPGNSNHNQDSNDEGAVNRGGRDTPSRNGKDKGNGKDK